MCWADRQCFRMMFHTVRVDLSEWGIVPREYVYPAGSFGMFYRMAQEHLKMEMIRALQR